MKHMTKAAKKILKAALKSGNKRRIKAAQSAKAVI